MPSALSAYGEMFVVGVENVFVLRTGQ